MLDRLPADATLIAIDTNADFIEFLEKDIADDRLIAVAGSAADVEQIIADARFRRMPTTSCRACPFRPCRPGVGAAIGEATAKVIRPGGAFLVYQFSPKVRDFIAPAFRADRPRLRMDQRARRRPCSGPGASQSRTAAE